MILYHYTCPLNWGRIETKKKIKRTESNLSPFEENAGPPVVWLTDDPYSANQIPWALTPQYPGSVFDKTAVRIAVDIDTAVPWLEWAKRHKINKIWRETLTEAGGGPEAVGHWYVTEHAIRVEDWLDVMSDLTVHAR